MQDNINDKPIAKDLLQRIKQGNRKAFEQVVKQYYNQFFQFAFQYLKNKEESEELVQDFFIDLWFKRDQLQIKNLEAYCWTAIRNKALNELAKSHKKVAQINVEDNLVINPVSSIEENELQLLLQNAINVLPEKAKEVFLLCREQNLTYQEASNKLGIGKETVKSHMKTALRKIKAFLKVNGYPLALLFFIL